MSALARFAGGCAFVAALAASGDAAAQLHWDASAGIGIDKRFLSSRPPGSDDAGFGPNIQIAGHIALMPLVRAGLYAGYEISPLPGDAAARDMIPLGAHFKIMSPVPNGDVRLWLFTGFGYTFVNARSYDTTVASPTGVGSNTTPLKGTVESAGGGFFEVPLGIGVSYKLFEALHLYSELGAHFGFGHHGSVYELPGPQLKSDGVPDNNALPSGKDTFGLGLMIGVLLD